MDAMLHALESIPDVEFRKDEPLARHTTLRVGGPVRLLARPRSESALFALLEAIRELGVPFIILGEGSNVLAPDGPREMVVIQLHLALGGECVKGQTPRPPAQQAGNPAGGPTAQAGNPAGGPTANPAAALAAYAGAGTRLRDLIRFCVENGLQGLEGLAGVPATVGGALFMNASTSFGAISDPLAHIDLLDAEGVKRTLSRQELHPGYRTMGLPQNCVVLGACFELRPCERSMLQNRVEEILEKRRKSQPLRYPSAGSVFKNPAGQFAGALIEKAGLKGFSIGDAQISKKHANWIVNRGKATAKDILGLIEKTENEIFGSFGVRLEREIRILDQLYRNPALC
ncbi:MAG: UDP-N-acetylmuramate dehydrogenase [Syntrophobacteraceae bacterium]